MEIEFNENRLPVFIGLSAKLDPGLFVVLVAEEDCHPDTWILDTRWVVIWVTWAGSRAPNVYE